MGGEVIIFLRYLLSYTFYYGDPCTFYPCHMSNNKTTCPPSPNKLTSIRPLLLRAYRKEYEIGYLFPLGWI
jgi:hypothetical protein